MVITSSSGQPNKPGPEITMPTQINDNLVDVQPIQCHGRPPNKTSRLVSTRNAQAVNENQKKLQWTPFQKVSLLHQTN